MSQMIESFMDAAAPSLRAQPLELEESSGSGTPGGELLRSAHPLHGVRVQLQVCVGEATMTLGELLSAREREVVVLERGLEHPVDLVLDGRVVARGELMAVDGSFAVRLTELPLPLRI